MLGFQTGVPVDLCVVEGEDAAAFHDLDVHVVRPGQDLVLEGAVDVFGADVVDLVDDGADERVLVDYYLGDDFFVGGEAVAEVEVGDVADGVEARGDVVVELFW